MDKDRKYIYIYIHTYVREVHQDTKKNKESDCLVYIYISQWRAGKKHRLKLLNSN